jgi:maleylacetate reductase
VVLSYALAYNSGYVPETMSALRRSMGVDDPVRALRDFSRGLGLPQSLAELGMAQDGIATATQLALQSAYWNPRPLVEEPLHDLIARAWAGLPPED